MKAQEKLARWMWDATMRLSKSTTHWNGLDEIQRARIRRVAAELLANPP